MILKDGQPGAEATFWDVLNYPNQRSQASPWLLFLDIGMVDRLQPPWQLQRKGLGPLTETDNANERAETWRWLLFARFLRSFHSGAFSHSAARFIVWKSKERLVVLPQQSCCCVNAFVSKQDGFSLLRADMTTLLIITL